MVSVLFVGRVESVFRINLAVLPRVATSDVITSEVTNSLKDLSY